MEPFEQQLQDLWKQGGRSLAVAFLRRAIEPNMTLRNLLAALQFGEAAPHLGDIRLQEVLPGAGVAPARAPAAVAVAPRTVARAEAPAKARRRRRSPAELAKMRADVCTMLVQEPGSLNTTQLASGLAAEDGPVDAVRLGALLRTLVQEELVTDLGGKPKGWRATAKLRGLGQKA